MSHAVAFDAPIQLVELEGLLLAFNTSLRHIRASADMSSFKSSAAVRV